MCKGTLILVTLSLTIAGVGCESNLDLGTSSTRSTGGASAFTNAGGRSGSAGSAAAGGTNRADSGATSGGADSGVARGNRGDAGSVDPSRPAGADCFGPGERPPSSEPSGFRMPTLDDERRTYRSWGLTWKPEAEPDAPADTSYVVQDPDIHGDTEGDDLWTYLVLFERTGENGYRDRANAWARYFENDYRSCVGASDRSFCYDRDAYGACHFWGWGLITLYEIRGDQAALDEAKHLGETLESLYGPNTTYGCLTKNGCTEYGVRRVGRHLLFATRLAEVTGDARWASLRDSILDLVLGSEDWDASFGTYFYGAWQTDQDLGQGSYAAGARIQSPFQLGVLTEAFDQAYRTTGREVLRERMVAIAKFVDRYGLDPTYDYTASTFGIVGGKVWHSYAAASPVTFWDPVYTTSLVNTLVRGYRYTCDVHYYERARHFFERGNRGIYGEPTKTASPDGTIHHFVDTRFATATGNFYLDYNKGELQYTYLVFDRALGVAASAAPGATDAGAQAPSGSVVSSAAPE